MLKASHFLGQSELGPTAVPLFGPADAEFEKRASASLMSDVVRYIERLTPSQGSQYVLVNAMGAGEYYGSNINGDHFPEAGLIHRPDDWSSNPLLDKVKAKEWSYGYPTFYNAHPYAHHRNKDVSRAYGEVELAAWNPSMKRVELVTRVDKDKCENFGGMGIWDKLKAGDYPDVSMGSKVPFDTCSICLNWDEYVSALQTFDSKKHRHPGIAVLEYHKNKPIRGLSITRKDYCDHAKSEMNRIYSDGRKVFVYNDFPRFFDISFVFIGADKTAKVMLFIFQGSGIYKAKPSAEVADDLGMEAEEVEKAASFDKVASVEDELFKRAFGKLAKNKSGEIDKRVVPSQFAGKAVPLLTNGEPDLPEDVIRLLGKLPLEKSLATTAGLGMLLKPHEFQKITISLENSGVKIKPEDFMPSLARLLSPFLATRSALGPFIEKRVLINSDKSDEAKKEASSHSSALLRKIGSAYNGYRKQVMDLVANTPEFLNESGEEFRKLGSAELDELFTPLSVAYLQQAYFNDLPFGDMASGMVQPSENRQMPAWRGDSPQ
jgi:hypothetical protein